MTGRAHIGTSGWHYAAWRDDFYHDLPKQQWLGFYCHQFNSVEINASFYRLQSLETYRRWHDETPPDFCFSLKGNRYLTHYKKLVGSLPSIILEREHAQGLGSKLAVVLWQLPAFLSVDIERLDKFVEALTVWPEVRHAIEFRHPSWFNENIAAFLNTHGIAVCQSDAADWPLWNAVTNQLVYLRLHGNKHTYVSSYTDQELEDWTKQVGSWLKEGKDVYVYFDNDGYGAALRNARMFSTLLKSVNN